MQSPSQAAAKSDGDDLSSMFALMESPSQAAANRHETGSNADGAVEDSRDPEEFVVANNLLASHSIDTFRKIQLESIDVGFSRPLYIGEAWEKFKSKTMLDKRLLEISAKEIYFQFCGKEDEQTLDLMKVKMEKSETRDEVIFWTHKRTILSRLIIMEQFKKKSANIPTAVTSKMCNLSSIQRVNLHFLLLVIMCLIEKLHFKLFFFISSMLALEVYAMTKIFATESV